MNSIIKAQTGNDASIIRFPGGSSNTVSKDYCPGIMTQLVNDVTARGFYTVTGMYRAEMQTASQSARNR